MLKFTLVLGFALLIPDGATFAQDQNAKPMVNCNPPHATASPGQPTNPPIAQPQNSQEIGASAVLPSAGGTPTTGAPTVSSNGKPVETRPDCPATPGPSDSVKPK